MPSLQKIHNREVRQSAEYIPQNRFWLVVTFLLVIVIGVILSEILTRGKVSPYCDGGWITYLVTEIRNKINEMLAVLRDSVRIAKSVHF